MGSNAIYFVNHTNTFSPSLLLLHSHSQPFPSAFKTNLPIRRRFHASDRPLPAPLAASSGAHSLNSSPSISKVYTVGDFMTRKENLLVVKPTTTVDKALEMLVQKRITGFPVIDDDWKLVGVVSDYDLLALDSISGGTQCDTNSLFPNVDSSWKTFNELQRLLSKTNGKVVGDLMTAAPLVVHETTNLEDAASRLLLETKYRRLPVVDGDGRLVGIITRGGVVRAALQIKRGNEKRA
ncbi:CBS domain-containing protein CBSX1, chloroplastic-like isoform X1 [Humulus lupulus]|uniref:CBS domain-containing protein CBSX1, chloroplastic-like isoform X1 n=1 Tax=Humulus lupulus TaxID=3486 RepID=UPI002B4083FA|nr:CBS domain-containing protein CBSX1, chloroplastic-like isoform X1 [Humulus lupulus]